MRHNVNSSHFPLGVPIVEERNFLLATREVGYRNLSAAIAELLDNAIQANARDISISLCGSTPDLSLAILDNAKGVSTTTEGRQL